MTDIINGLCEACNLLITGDAELLTIISLSLIVSFTACCISAVVFLPLGILVGVSEFYGKRILRRFVHSWMSVPSVVVGLVVFLVFSRNGPMGFLSLMYTPALMIIAQTALISPLVMCLIWFNCEDSAKEYYLIAKTLGANQFQRFLLIICELRHVLFAQMMIAFSRAISEVGAVMIVGGNIYKETRVMTTAISRYVSMGLYDQAIALGIVLLTLSLAINFVVVPLGKSE